MVMLLHEVMLFMQRMSKKQFTETKRSSLTKYFARAKKTNIFLNMLSSRNSGLNLLHAFHKKVIASVVDRKDCILQVSRAIFFSIIIKFNLYLYSKVNPMTCKAYLISYQVCWDQCKWLEKKH